MIFIFTEKELEIILIFLNRLLLTTKGQNRQLNGVLAHITNTMLEDLKLEHKKMIGLTKGQIPVQDYSGITFWITSITFLKSFFKIL